MSYKKWTVELITTSNDKVLNSCEVEKKFVDKYRKYKHTPLKKFKGHSECFNIEVLEELKKGHLAP